MTSRGSRYREEKAPDYSHRFHAGNVGDVWKHCALVILLDAVAARGARVAYIDSHAGEGSYDLGPTGEWIEGLGRLWTDAELAARDDAVGRYLTLCRALGTGSRERPSCVPGSPAFAGAVLGRDASLVLYERERKACSRLTERVGGDSRVRLVEGDGLEALPSEVTAAESSADSVVVLLDPPWTRKSDWTSVPDLLAAAVVATVRTCFMLWYPLKSLTRPNAMIARLAAAGVAGTVVEFVTTPLEHQRNRLNGSGVVLVRAPEAVFSRLAAAAPVLGARCATRAGAWSSRTQAWAAG